jgi:hypothetical protein
MYTISVAHTNCLSSIINYYASEKNNLFNIIQSMCSIINIDKVVKKHINLF